MGMLNPNKRTGKQIRERYFYKVIFIFLDIPTIFIPLLIKMHLPMKKEESFLKNTPNMETNGVKLQSTSQEGKC
jgi:hypothetical protein